MAGPAVAVDCNSQMIFGIDVNSFMIFGEYSQPKADDSPKLYQIGGSVLAGLLLIAVAAVTARRSRALNRKRLDNSKEIELRAQSS